MFDHCALGHRCCRFELVINVLRIVLPGKFRSLWLCFRWYVNIFFILRLCFLCPLLLWFTPNLHVFSGQRLCFLRALWVMVMPALRFELKLQLALALWVYLWRWGWKEVWEQQQMALKEVYTGMCHWNSSRGPCVLRVWEAELAHKCLLWDEWYRKGTSYSIASL